MQLCSGKADTVQSEYAAYLIFEDERDGPPFTHNHNHSHNNPAPTIPPKTITTTLILTLLSLLPPCITAANCATFSLPSYPNLANDAQIVANTVCSGDGSTCATIKGMLKCVATSGKVTGGFMSASNGVLGECAVSFALRRNVCVVNG